MNEQSYHGSNNNLQTGISTVKILDGVPSHSSAGGGQPGTALNPY